MAECTVESASIPQLPLVVVTKVASMLQRNKREHRWVLKDRLQLAAVSRELRQAVLSGIQQMERRWMIVEIKNNTIFINDVALKKYEDGNEGSFRAGLNRLNQAMQSTAQPVLRRMLPSRGNHDHKKNQLLPAYSQMDCIDALHIFVQPNSLHLTLNCDRKLSDQVVDLPLFSPPSLTSLVLVLKEEVGKVGEESPLSRTLKVIASLTNLETLSISINCDDAVAAKHAKSTPSVPNDGPFDHLLTLRHLRALHIDAPGLLSAAQMADLLNRCESKITDLCCDCYPTSHWIALFAGVNDAIRAHVTSVCCCFCFKDEQQTMNWLPSFWLSCQALATLPNCSRVHCATQMQQHSLIDFALMELGGRLLDMYHANGGGRARTLECTINLNAGLYVYMVGGGDTELTHTRDDTVVRLLIGNAPVKQKTCPFNINPHHHL